MRRLQTWHISAVLFVVCWLALCFVFTLKLFGSEFIPHPSDNPPDYARSHIGWLLAHDKRMSQNGTISCMSCHKSEFAYADDKPLSRGINNQLTNRNTPGLLDAAFEVLQFRNGRANLLEEQCLQPLVAANEMGQQTLNDVVNRINSIRGYRDLFLKEFGLECNVTNLPMTFAAFERTLTSGENKADRFQKGDIDDMDVHQLRGAMLFFGKAGCAQCHAGHTYSKPQNMLAFENDKRFGYTAEATLEAQFVNTGVARRFNENDTGRASAPGQNKPENQRKFKVARLREVQMRKQFMHLGEFKSLLDVVNYYNNPETSDRRLDTRIKPLGLTSEEKIDLVVFLSTCFKGENYPYVPAPVSFPQ